MRRNTLVVLELISFFGFFFSGFVSVGALMYSYYYSDHLISFPVYIGLPAILAFLYMWCNAYRRYKDLEEER